MKETFRPRPQKFTAMKRKFHEDPPAFYLTLSDEEITEFYGKGAIKEINAVKKYIEYGCSANQCIITQSQDAQKVLRPLIAYSEHEKFAIAYLNNRNEIIYTEIHSEGSQTGTVVDVRRIVKTALKRNANSIIIAHNHPSGNLKPSPADLSITKKIKDALAFFEIDLLDSLIITSQNYVSFADKGLI